MRQALERLYPYESFLTSDGQKMVVDLMKRLEIDAEDGNLPPRRVKKDPQSLFFC